MGNSESHIPASNETKSKKTTPIIKTKINTISHNNLSTDKGLNSTIPTYHNKQNEQLDKGIQTYQYFKAPVNRDSIEGKIGIYTQADNKYSYDVNTLYQNEKKYRETVDCSNEIPYTRSELDNEFKNRNDNYYNHIPNNNKQNNDYNQIKDTLMKPVNTPNSNIDTRVADNQSKNSMSYTNIDNNNVSTEHLGITRAQALEIRDFRYLTNLEKRIMIMNNITLYNLDPLDIQACEKLNLSKLIKKYTSLRNIYHPDKGGNTKMFILVNQALESQKYIQQSKILDKDYTQLRNEYNTYNETEKKKKPIDSSILKSFSTSKFNKFFQSNKFNDEFEDSGYGNMMEDNGGEREDIDIEKIDITDKYTFEDHFKKNINKYTTDIQTYSVPQPLDRTNNHILGSKYDNYSGSTDSIHYSDYKEAFELANIDRKDVNIELDYEKYIQRRKNDKLQMSDVQRKLMEDYETKTIEKEEQRKLNLESQDVKINNYYNKTNKQLLEYI